jgi:hypothetical protein
MGWFELAVYVRAIAVPAAATGRSLYLTGRNGWENTGHQRVRTYSMSYVDLIPIVHVREKPPKQKKKRKRKGEEAGLSRERQFGIRAP